jgi:hypothetical protein
MAALSRLLRAAEQTCTLVAPESAVGTAQGLRSHLADGRVVCWSASVPRGLRLAVDAEISDQPVPPALAYRFDLVDPHRFWAAWTAVEVSCKLRDVPILTWLKRRGLTPDPAIRTRTLRIADITVTCGAADLGHAVVNDRMQDRVQGAWQTPEGPYDRERRRSMTFARRV